MSRHFPGRDSIRTRILMLVSAVSMSAILLLVAMILVRDFFSKRDSKVRQFNSVAGVLADNLTVAVSFREDDAAKDLLKSLASESSIHSAVVIDPDAHVFATFGDSAGLEKQIELWFAQHTEAAGIRSHEFEGDLLTVRIPIVEFDTVIGSLVITADTSDIWAELTMFTRDTCLACAVVLVMALVVSRQLQESITKPILALADTAARVSEDKDYSVRVTHEASGEVAVLRDQFNLMLQQLETTTEQIATSQLELQKHNQLLEQRVAERTGELANEVERTHHAYSELQNLQDQLADTARSAGMAEIANGVLHNIGNVLNSINVSAQLSVEHLRALPVEKLDRVALLLQNKKQELGADWTSFQGLAALPDLLLQIASAFNTQRESVNSELRHLEEHIDFVKQIVQSQQSFSRQGGMQQDVSAAEIFETACKFVVCKERHAQIRIERQFEFVGSLRTDKGKLLQILSNYVKNGLEAVHECPNGQPTLLMATRLLAGDMVEFSVTDNGHGIDDKTLEGIFRHGFTTKADGHGFGLHSAACAAKEMDGSVAVHSDGPGQGARFCVRVPLCHADAPIPA